MAGRRRRAPPMSPEERRASIVEAAMPLLRKHGEKVTTAQIAKAAGVAEGTLFRAFRDKPELVAATIRAALDPAPAEAQLRAIDPDLALREQLIAAIEILAQRIEQVGHLMSMLGRSVDSARAELMRGRRGADPTTPVRTCLTALLSRHAGELRYTPRRAAQLLYAMAFAGTHPRLAGPKPLPPPVIVDMLLDGIRARPEESD